MVVTFNELEVAKGFYNIATPMAKFPINKVIL